MAPRSLVGTALVAAALTVVAGCTAGASGVQRAGATAPAPPAATPSTSAPAPAPLSPLPPSADVRTGRWWPIEPTPARLRSARSRPVEDPYYPGTSNPEFDALHYLLRLDWNGTRLKGRTTVLFRAAATTRQVRLDLSQALRAGSVRLDGRSIAYSQSGDAIVMRTGRLRENTRHVVTIAYAGVPHSTPAPSRRSDLAEGLGWNVDRHGSVYTFQEPYGAFTWYPVNDEPSDKALYDAVISTHGRDVAVFNGDLVSRSRHGGTTVSRWHLDAPAASYLTTLAIGPYSRSVVTTGSGMDIAYWVLPRDRSALRILETEGSNAFDWLVAHAGPYPFDSLGVVVVDGDSAMETQTMITFGRTELSRPDSVLEHEMAHQWFGDSLTPRTWPDLWLNEGWAMYMEQWFESTTHRQPYAGGITHWRHLDQQSRDRSGPPASYGPQTFGDLNVYLGPAMMLDAIRVRIGDSAFDRLVKAWARRHALSTVSRALFTRWLQADTGRQLGPLLHAWLDSGRTPRLPR
jgi:aminopeptidase N